MSSESARPTDGETGASGDRLPAGPRIGYWGRFNVGRFGDLLLPWIFEREILKRLPDAVVQPYAPLGPRHPAPLDAGFAAAELGDWSPRRAAELADSLHCVVVAGDVIQTRDEALSADYGTESDEALRSHPSRFFVEGLEARLERRCPVAWDAVGVPFDLDSAGARRVCEAAASRPYLSVRDRASRDRLLRAGLEGNLPVVPDPLLLLSRVFPAALLARRLEFEKHMEWFPREGEPLVLQGSSALVRSAEVLADVVADTATALGAPVVILELDPGDGEFSDALARTLPGPVFRVPREAALVDRVAALAHAKAFLGSSSAGALASAAFGTPSLLLEMPRLAQLPASVRRLLSTARERAGPPPALEKRLDVHFDRLARVAEEAFARRLRESGDPVPRLLRLLRESDRRLKAWRTAHESRSRQVVAGRLQAAAIVEKSRAEGTARIDELSWQVSETHSERDALRAEAEKAAGAGAARIEELSWQLSEARSERDSSRAETGRLSESLASLAGKLAAVEAAPERSRQSEEALGADRARLVEELAREKASLARAAAEVERRWTERERIESLLAQARERAQSLAQELAAAREETIHVREDGERQSERAEKMVVELRAELDRAEARLEQYRSEDAELRLSQTLLFTELAEARSDAARFTGRFDEPDAPEEKSGRRENPS